MKATNSIHKPLLFGKLIIILVTFLSFSFNSLVAKNNVKLSQVFTTDVSPSDKQVLKLYDDNSYEFLHFVIAYKKPKVIREQGSYVLESNKLKLKSRTKKGVIDHPKHYFFLSERGLFKSRAQAKRVNASPSMETNKDSKYYEVFYIDSVFGKVSNDPKVINKLADPKLKEKKKEVINTPSENKRDTTGNYEFWKAAIKKDIKLSIDTLRMIKAVVVVGPVEESTKSFITEKKELVLFLRSIGVQVTEFYHPNAKWNDIVEASKGANIFIYSGHGSTMGENGGAGGLCVTDGLYSAESITNEIKLAKNALVLFNHVCGGAGSSADDTKDIGKEEAMKRVGDYAKPFIINNAAAYYANNYSYCLESILTDFFNRKNKRHL
ncbi:MAG: hypothetical protein IPG89_08380 [Bacteroidetes bacterium]|nr:hypothetical protein [Bacteroidota bacterium]